jgi:hypothetical protein
VIDCGRIQVRLRVNAASHEDQRGGKDHRISRFHIEIFSSSVLIEGKTTSSRRSPLKAAFAA